MYLVTPGVNINSALRSLAALKTRATSFSCSSRLQVRLLLRLDSIFAARIILRILSSHAKQVSDP
jgi:hypothetical protein